MLFQNTKELFGNHSKVLFYVIRKKERLVKHFPPRCPFRSFKSCHDAHLALAHRAIGPWCQSNCQVLDASDHGMVTADLPWSAPAPLRLGAHLTLYKSHAHPPSRVCSLEGRALLFCGTYCA